MNEQLDLIKTQVMSWVKDHLSNDFVFRENQLEVISELVYDKLNGISHHIIQAPTGSGKSLINLITAGVLYEFYEKKSYILCSDLYLYQQYIDFIDKYNLEDFKYCKGQTGNYECHKGHCDIRCAQCKMARVKYSTLYNIIEDIKPEGDKRYEKAYKRFQCAKSCDYLFERFDAVDAPITVMTYQLFYFQMNICTQKNDSHGDPIKGQFQYRDYIFCDECHNIPGIIQARCKPMVKHDDLEKMLHIYNYYKLLKKNPANNKFLQKCPDETEINKMFSDYWKQMNDDSLDSYANTILLLNYTRKIVKYINICGERLQNMFGNKVFNGKKLSDKENEIYSEITWLQNYKCFLSDFCSAIELSGFHHTYKQISKVGVTFGTVKEDGIIFYFLLRHGLCGTTLCSATCGNIESFMENCGYNHFENSKYTENELSHKAKFIDLPSTFNFDNSPIYIDLEYKINYTNKSKVVEPIAKKVEIILNKHKDENGMIQTGSFENANNLYNLLSEKNKKRILLYTNNDDKKRFISKINDQTNYILMGPTLNEGIDLPGKLCSFIIIEKVPFMSLGDRYVQKKMRLFKKWYNDQAATNIIQGIGRGNRFKNDFCEIYIIDGCFKKLYSYTKKYFPQFIIDRFKYTSVEQLCNNEISLNVA